ncbi:MAG: hypothetical protein AAGJ81_01380 [Verrucomicrobiota bacterium]
MAHESTFAINFGTFQLVAAGDLVESEVNLNRVPDAPQRSRPIGAASSSYYGGLNLSHTMTWAIRREFDTIAAARFWEFQRPALLPEGRNDLRLIVAGITATLAGAHLTNYSLKHVKGKFAIIESVSVLGGAYSQSGSFAEDASPGIPAQPVSIDQLIAGTPAPPESLEQLIADTPAIPIELDIPSPADPANPDTIGPASPATPAPPVTQPVSALWLLTNGLWSDSRRWRDEASWEDN